MLGRKPGYQGEERRQENREGKRLKTKSKTPRLSEV